MAWQNRAIHGPVFIPSPLNVIGALVEHGGHFLAAPCRVSLSLIKLRHRQLIVSKVLYPKPSRIFSRITIKQLQGPCDDFGSSDPPPATQPESQSNPPTLCRSKCATERFVNTRHLHSLHCGSIFLQAKLSICLWVLYLCIHCTWLI